MFNKNGSITIGNREKETSEERNRTLKGLGEKS